MNHDVFISYSKKDKNVADAICHYLEESKIKCWIAPRDVRAGADYGSEIVHSIRKSKVFILVFSGHTNKSQHVSNEVNIAFESTNLIMPYRIEDVGLNDTMTYYLNNKHWIDSFPDPKSKFALLKDQIRIIIPVTEEPEPEIEKVKKEKLKPRLKSEEQEKPEEKETEKEEFVFCIDCGKKVSAVDFFCMNCGTAIK